MKRPLSTKEMNKLKKFIKDRLGVSPSIRTTPIEGQYIGLYYPDLDLIEIEPGLSRSMYIHTVLHEAMHAYCVKNGIFKAYHSCSELTATKEEYTAWAKTAARAEHYVERNATELTKEFDPSLKIAGVSKEKIQEDFKLYKKTLKRP